MNVNLTPGVMGIQGRICEISKMKCRSPGILRFEEPPDHSGGNPFILYISLLPIADGLHRAVGKTAQAVDAFVLRPDHSVLFLVKSPAFSRTVFFAESASGADFIINF